LIVGLLVLLGFQLLGEGLRLALHLPLPGPVVGMLLLAAVLAARSAGSPPQGADSGRLDRVAGLLLEHMGLLFVPAGVGLVAELPLLRQEWAPLLGGVLGSTLLGLVTTAAVLHHVSCRRPVAIAQAR
jgi:holin-like protein